MGLLILFWLFRVEFVFLIQFLNEGCPSTKPVDVDSFSTNDVDVDCASTKGWSTSTIDRDFRRKKKNPARLYLKNDLCQLFSSESHVIIATWVVSFKDYFSAASPRPTDVPSPSPTNVPSPSPTNVPSPSPTDVPTVVETTVSTSTTVSNIQTSECGAVQSALRETTASELQTSTEKVTVGNFYAISRLSTPFRENKNSSRPTKMTRKPTQTRL